MTNNVSSFGVGFAAFLVSCICIVSAVGPAQFIG
jgi:hypothetical protein